MLRSELYSQSEYRLGSERSRELVEQALEELVHTLGYRRAFVALANAKKNALEGSWGVNIPQALLESMNAPMETQTPPLVQTLILGRVVHVEDTQRDPRIPAQMKEFYANASISSFAAIPLLPAPGVLVVSKDVPVTEKDLVELLPHASRLAVTLWETLHRSPPQGQPNRYEIEREWLWAMVNSVPHPIVLCDEQNTILLQNIHAERLFKTSPDDSEGKRHAIELNSFLFSAALSSYSLDQGEVPGRELTLVDPIEGSELLYEMICRPATNLRTGERGVVAFLENVTDLRRAVVELRRSLAEIQSVNDQVRRERDRLNLILENLENPIVVTSPASEIILMNSSAERLLQIPGEPDASGKATVYLTNDAKLTSFLAQFQLETPDVRRGELQLVDPATEEMLSLDVTATKARNQLGQVVAIVCVLQDLTRIKELERRRLEHQLVESEKLAAVGRLAAAVAHEVNNPLEAIKNALHLVVSSMPANNPDRKFLDIANRETQRVSDIIRQMLSFYSTGTVKTSVDVNTILEEAIALLQVQFKGYITWRTSLGRNLPRINASADKLKQVFLNLFLNAREAMDQPGEIRVVTRLSRVADAEYLPGKYVLIEISDTGTGISEENLTRIFDPFFSTKRERHGTGLGLWVSQDIVHQHGGQIKVRSQPGHGSTFTVALPIGGENEQISRLLVVDDDESVTITLQAVLERDGYFVLTASSAAEVQGLLGKERFDVALVDLRLGDADGMDVVRKIRASLPGCEAIVLTGYASLESAVEAIRQGAYDYLVKPCDLDELRLTVKGAVERSMLAWIASKRLEDQDAAIREMQALVQELRRNLDRISSELAEIKLQLQQSHLRSR